MNETRLLVADDDPDIRSVVAELLTEAGYQVEVFADGMEAWKAFEQSPKRFAGLVTDLMMPGLTGDELARRARTLCPSLPIVIATSSTGDARLHELSTSRFVRIIAKPGHLGELVERVAAVVAAARKEVQEVQPAAVSRRFAHDDQSVSRGPGAGARFFRPTPGLVGVALAASVALFMFVSSQFPTAPELPSRPESGLARGFVVEVDEPRGEIVEKPAVLRWRGVTEARDYSVSLWRGADRLELEARSEQTWFELPEGILQSFDRGVTFRWSVRAFDAEGRMLADSGPVVFRIAPGSGGE